MNLLVVLFFLMTSSNALGDSLKIYVIEPKIAIDWSSPRNLSITSGIDSARSDYAPIGHFAIEVSCSHFNSYGVNHVLTGMERKDKAESRRITLEEKLGLGSLFYSFEGDLQSAKTSTSEIIQAKKDQRLKIIEIPTSKDRCDSMMNFLETWIKFGSYQVYGGGKKTSQGEGAGCADFAMQFFKIATGSRAPKEWSASIHIPDSLLGSKVHPVAFTQLITRNFWALKGESSTHFQIPDTNFVGNWFVKNGKVCGNKFIWSKHILGNDGQNMSCEVLRNEINNKVESLSSKELENFEFSYPTEKFPLDLWNGIRM
jgi:hypothetical protein